MVFDTSETLSVKSGVSSWFPMTRQSSRNMSLSLPSGNSPDKRYGAKWGFLPWREICPEAELGAKTNAKNVAMQHSRRRLYWRCPAAAAIIASSKQEVLLAIAWPERYEPEAPQLCGCVQYCSQTLQCFLADDRVCQEPSTATLPASGKRKTNMRSGPALIQCATM